MNLMFWSILILLISLILLMINFLLMKKYFKMREKNNPFECGFSPISLMRLPFSLQFFFITILFLIFDVEMTLIFPFIKNFYINMNYWIFNSMMIFFLLLMGLFIEWLNNFIMWFK